jgi:hypothetical protein
MNSESNPTYQEAFLLKQFFGEGPRSRWYGRTAALRLIVQPCDEDDEKDDFFCHVSK